MSNLVMVQPMLAKAPRLCPDRPARGSPAVRAIRCNLFDSSPEKSSVDTLILEENEKNLKYVKARYNIDLRKLEEKCNIAISVNPKHGQRFANTQPYNIQLPGLKGTFKVVKGSKYISQKQCLNNNNNNSSNNNNIIKKKDNNNTAAGSHYSEMGAKEKKQEETAAEAEAAAETQKAAAAAAEKAAVAAEEQGVPAAVGGGGGGGDEK